MEHVSSLPRSQQPATRPNPEPDQSIPHLFALLLFSHFDTNFQSSLLRPDFPHPQIYAP
jgi:hypothetical protein